MPGARVFVDTNILLYAHDRRDPAKETAAKAWLLALARYRAGTTNLQVLNELTAVLLRKKWYGSADEAFAIVNLYATLGDRPITRVEVERARNLHMTTRYSWWDCLLLASALELGCRWFLSEDLRDGHEIEGLTIVDPFAHSPAQLPIS